MATGETAVTDTLRLMAVLAHPDDESLGFGGTLARYAAEGVQTFLVTATRGERGWTGDPAEDPGLEAMGTTREAELRAAAQVLGLREIHLLGYVDGELAQADAGQAVARIVGHLRRIRPHVVLTFDPQGSYGHPDHIAICQLTTAAVLAAADAAYAAESLPAHRISKLYYMVDSETRWIDYQRAFGDVSMQLDGVKRQGIAWPDWAITTRLDATAYAQRVWRAVACHRSQLPQYAALAQLTPHEHEALWGRQEYYRALSLVNGGQATERDLLAGLRAPDAVPVGDTR